MPDPLVPEVRPRGVFTEEGPTDFGTFAADLLGAPPTRDFAAERAALTPRREAKEAERQKAVGAVTAELERTTTDLSTDAAARAKEREAGRAERDVSTRKLTEQGTPEFTARPFLAPGAGILNQLQSALVGVTAMATQIRGLSGSAIPAMAAMKGLAEGYAKGDRERIDNEWAAWKAANAKLTAAHKAAVEKYRDLVEDQTLSAAEKQLLASVRLKGLEFVAGQRALEAQDIEAQLKEVSAAEDRERKHEEVIKRLDEQMGRHNATQKRLDTAHADLQEQRRIVNARADRNEKLHREIAGPVVKWQQQLVNNQQVLEDLGTMETHVKRLADAGLLQRTPAMWEAVRAGVAQRISDDPALKEAMDWMQRLGSARLAAAEIAAGEPASAMRLKAVGEPQLAHVLSAGPQFWTSFFARTRRGIERQNALARENLKAVNPAMLQRTGPASEDEWEPVK